MNVGTRYGFVLGSLLVLLDALNLPLAWAAFWAIQATMLTIYTVLTWRRMHLLLVTAGGAHAALVAAALVPAFLAGYTLRTLPGGWQTIFWINAAVLAASQGLCWLLYRETFQRWKRHMEPMSLRDLFRFRHIPDLRMDPTRRTA